MDILYKKTINSNNYITILNIFIFLSNISICILFNCSIVLPIKNNNNGECIAGCSASEFQSGVCIIENDIIKTQSLNKIIPYSEGGINYATLSTTPDGNLICSSSYFRSSTKKYYFGLKKNGRPLFIENDQETLYSTTDSDKVRNEGNIFGIKLNGTNNEEEYIIAFGNNVINVEIYDFTDNNNVIIYKQLGTTFFKTGYNSFQRASIFKIKNDEEDYYIISFIAQPPSSSNKCFYIMKFLFTSLDITSYSPLLKSDKINSANIAISSCFETENHYIFCFYLNDEDNYIAIVYDNDINRIYNQTVASAAPHSIYDFYKCVHFTGEAGAFLYYDINKNITIEFKEFDSKNIKDYFTSKTMIKIKNYNYNNITKNSDMIKLDDKKLCFVVMSSDQTEFNLFIINNYKDEKIKIRHYNLKINNLYLYKITDELKISLYNELIAMACTTRYNYGSLTSSIIIFSFPNSTDFNLDLTNDLLSFNNSIIKFYEKCNIENNIFGYIFVGVKIIDISKGYKILSVKKSTEVKKDNILYDDDSAELYLTEGINVEEAGRIIYAMVLTEPEYNIFNQYAIEIDNSYCGENCDDEKDIFKNNLYIGRNSYVDISIDSNSISTDCEENNENCIVCIKENKACISCKFSYELLENGEKSCLNENEGIDSTFENNISDEIIESTIKEEKTNIKSNEILGSSIIQEKNNIESDLIIESAINKESESIIKNDNSQILASSIINQETNFISEKIIESSKLNIKTNSITEQIIDNTFIKTQNNSINDSKNINNKMECSNEEILNNNCSGKASIEQIEEVKRNILNNNYTKENIIIRTNNIIAQLSKLEDQENEEQNLSNLNLGECEHKLKNAYKIPEDESLIIYKTDIKLEGFSSTYVSFEVYDPFTLQLLNISICNDVEISINVPVELNHDIEVLYQSLNESGYNLFDKNDSFYNDICAKYTTVNGTDILLSDRQNDIYTKSQNENDSLCQDGCELKSYSIKTKKVKCDCILIEQVTQNNIENQFNIKSIGNNFFISLNNSNFRVLKCYKLIFDISTIKKNIGLIIMTVIFIIIFILNIIFIIIGQKQINNNIKLVLQLKKKDPPNLKGKEKAKVKRKSSIKIRNKKSIISINNEKRKKDIKREKSRFSITGKNKKSARKSIKKLKGKINKAPPKKVKNNNSSQIGKKDEENKNLNNKVSKNLINNNILFNIKVIKSRRKKKARTIYSINNKKISRNNRFKYSIKKNDSETTKKKSFNNNSVLLFKKENKKKIEFDPNDYRLLNDYEMNNLKYQIALIIDNRTYCQFYWSLLKLKQIILFTFCVSNDYNIIFLKIALFFISFSLYFTINGFFFSDQSMHKVYIDCGKYNFLFRISQMIYSTLISTVINTILKILTLSQKDILEIKKEKEYHHAYEKSKKINLRLKIRFWIFCIISFLLMIFFWYFISCFCAVFVNTQIILIKDTLISFSLSMMYPFGIYLLPGIFRIYSLRSKEKNKECIYKFSQLLSLI